MCLLFKTILKVTYLIIILWISLEKGECFDFNHSLGCVYPTLYIIRLLRLSLSFQLADLLSLFIITIKLFSKEKQFFLIFSRKTENVDYIFCQNCHINIKLSPYSIMNVKLAAQVLRSIVSKTLTSYGPAEAAGTGKFFLLMESFFDLMNIHNIQSHEFERKPFLAPSTSVNEDRFRWLQNVFLKYVGDWLTSIEQRLGNFSRSALTNCV